jgi:hypothetical protein
MEEQLEAVFSVQSMPRLHKELIVHCELVPCMEVGLNTSTIALQVIGGDEKGTQRPGVYQGHPVPGSYK